MRLEVWQLRQDCVVLLRRRLRWSSSATLEGLAAALFFVTGASDMQVKDGLVVAVELQSSETHLSFVWPVPSDVRLVKKTAEPMGGWRRMRYGNC